MATFYLGMATLFLGLATLFLGIIFFKMATFWYRTDLRSDEIESFEKCDFRTRCSRIFCFKIANGAVPKCSHFEKK